MEVIHDWKNITSSLSRLIRIVPTPVGLQFCESEEEVDSIPKVRFSDVRFTACQGIGQAIQLGWTVGILPKNIHADYCRIIHGMVSPDEKFYSGKMFANIWNDEESAKEHHCNLVCAPNRYIALVASPLGSNRLTRVDVCLLYGTSGQLFMLLSGLLYSDYRKLDFTFSGESSCTDTWIRTLVTGKPCIGLPSFAERKFGGVADNEVALSIKPHDLIKAIEGMEKLHANGLRYPIAPYSLTTDVMAGMPDSYKLF
ncbi:MAG: DUF169 domain-containing protein [Eubacteriales bacterium]|nr:DUF169 domain-containing protein [Eubacteriales bacterium]